MRKRIADLPLEEQGRIRAANREYKKKQRAAEKAELIPSHDDWTWKWDQDFPQQYAELRAFEKQFTAKVYEELGETFGSYSSVGDTLAQVAIASYCFKKKDSPWVREVQEGTIVGGVFFPEVLGSGLVANTHHCGLERSACFAAAYRELLRILDKTFGHVRTTDALERKCAADVRAELDGTYIYVPPAPPQPKPEPKPVPQSVEAKVEPVTQEAQQIPNVIWSQLNKDLDELAKCFLEETT
jgi:hypothetical protein